MTTTIESYLNSLSEDILTLDIIGKGIEFLPDLTRFKKLKKLNCHNNKLTSLSNLPQKLEILYCTNNQITSLSNLPQSLKELYCANNQITSLYNLPQSLKELYCYNNPFYKIVEGNTLIKTKQNIQTLNNFCYLYYCLKFKNQFRKWLWEKVREPHAKKLYDPIYLVKNLKEEDDLDTVLYNWK